MFCFGICVLLWYFCTWPHVTVASEVSSLETSEKENVMVPAAYVNSHTSAAFLISALYSK